MAVFTIFNYRNKHNQKIYRLLAYAVDKTTASNARRMVVYCPDDDGNAVFVRDEDEFDAKFEKCEDA